MREAWSSPTRTAARPGVTPRSASARTRSLTSLRICAATAFPSRTRAVTLGILPGDVSGIGRRIDGAADARDHARPPSLAAVVLTSGDLDDVVDREPGVTHPLQRSGQVRMAEVHRRAHPVVVELL